MILSLQSISLLNANCKSQPAIIWIVDNQKGRRNVATPEQKEYISGKRYEAQKNINKFKGNQYTGDVQNAQNQDPSLDTTAKRQAVDEGTHEATVRRNAKFAEGVDAVREVSPQLAEKQPIGGEVQPSPFSIRSQWPRGMLVRQPGLKRYSMKYKLFYGLHR